MTCEDIIRMAREAGCGWTANGTEPMLLGEKQIERFAALVAEAEREACAKIAHDSVSKVCEEAAAVLRRLHEENERLRVAVLAEREACAKVCDELRPSKPEYDQRFHDGCTISAAAIRARGEV